MSFAPSPLIPPLPAREMRAAWIATVANIDWPSKPGLSVDQQKAELVSLLTQAQLLHLNTVFFQVRSVADAMYASPLEPWSEYFTGVQGKMPQPFYDPLAFAIEEA
ncbi:MAG TPA: family 10 glycosylhydrolase, partial [Candidatus Binatia bacterium]|nr:family 10 glycosylhydrolase [Candidatus Binatia bacterium]